MANKNYMTLEIGGKVRGLKMDFGAAEVVCSVYEGNPFDYASDATNMQTFHKLVPCLVYGGLVRNCEKKNENPDFTFDDVKKWMRDLEHAPVELIPMFFGTYDAAPASQEGGKDTQQKATNVGGNKRNRVR